MKNEKFIEYGNSNWALLDEFYYNNENVNKSVNTYDRLLIYRNILKNGKWGKLTLCVEKTINGIKYQIRRN